MSSILGIPLGLLLTLAADQIVCVSRSVIVGFPIHAIVPGTRAPVDDTLAECGCTARDFCRAFWAARMA